MEKPISNKNHSEVDKVSYESVRNLNNDPPGPVAFKKLDDERVHTSPYDVDTGTSRLKGKKESTHSKISKSSAIPMNPVCDKIDIKQTGPQKYEPSPIRTDGSFEGCYNEYDQPEVFIDDKIDID